jgi:hypothetical protein
VIDKAVDALIGLAAFPAEQALAISLVKRQLDTEDLWERSRPLCPHLTVSGKEQDDSERPAKLRRHLRRQRRQFRD